MSKMFRALQKADQLEHDGNVLFTRNADADAPTAIAKEAPGEFHNDRAETSPRQHLVYTIGIAVLLIVTALSLYITSRLLAEVHKSKEHALSVVETLDQQRKKIGQLEAAYGNMQGRMKTSEAKWQSSFKELENNLKAREKEIAEVNINYNILRVLANDLTATNQKLMEKLMVVNDEIDKLKQAGPAL